jgi:methylated-DNA-protein-cysteine methyltransferase-like protein
MLFREIRFLYRLVPFAVLRFLSKPWHAFGSQCIKHASARFVVAVEQTAEEFSSMLFRKRNERVNKMSWDTVYRVVKQIPRGRVLSYGALARILRLPGGARSAGRAMAATPSGKGIPWHRVVGERGKILIREPYASLQKKLLESEGVQIVESRVDLRSHLWKPAQKRKAKKTAAKPKRPRRPARK